MDLKTRVYRALGGAPTSKTARAISVSLMTFIFLNVLAVIVESVESIGAQYGSYFATFETFSVTVFATEYVLRVWSCTCASRFHPPFTGRLRYIFTPLAIIDLLAILPTMLMWSGIDLRVLRMVRMVRMFRLAKLGRYSRTLQTMVDLIRHKREELALSLLLMLTMLIIASSLMYTVENAQQPEAFSSIPASMWWGITTLTTVGYGDVYPLTAAGKLLAASISVIGIGLFALPAGIIASAFVELHGQEKCESSRVCPHCGKSLGEPAGTVNGPH
ncbi:MAG: ion transporter [Burkholderiales bacterium]